MHATPHSPRNGEPGRTGIARHHTVRVPAAQAAVVLDAMIATYARKVDALAAATRGYRTDREPLSAVVGSRREVIEAEAALDAVGWHLGDRTADLELSGPAGAVREVLYAALLGAAEDARSACREYEHGRLDRGALAAAITTVGTLHALFAALEDADSPETLAGTLRRLAPHAGRAAPRATGLGREVPHAGASGRLVPVPAGSSSFRAE